MACSWILHGAIQAEMALERNPVCSASPGYPQPCSEPPGSAARWDSPSWRAAPSWDSPGATGQEQQNLCQPWAQSWSLPRAPRVLGCIAAGGWTPRRSNSSCLWRFFPLVGLSPSFSPLVSVHWCPAIPHSLLGTCGRPSRVLLSLQFCNKSIFNCCLSSFTPGELSPSSHSQFPFSGTMFLVQVPSTWSKSKWELFSHLFRASVDAIQGLCSPALPSILAKSSCHCSSSSC